VNIFDFDQEIYNQRIRMEFHNFVREDIKFSSLAELITQIAKDKVDVETLLSS
jgi:riboflavin kinase/FMN adenylyltransferase